MCSQEKIDTESVIFFIEKRFFSDEIQPNHDFQTIEDFYSNNRNQQQLFAQCSS